MTTASSGVISPVAIAAIRESNAATRSPGALISGKTNATARPFGRGATRSSPSLAAVMSRSLAASPTARTTSSISSCISFSASTVARLRAPLGLPAGLPDCPGSNCRPGPRLRCFFCAFLTIIVLTHTGARGFRGTDKFRLAARACSQVRRQAPRGQLSGMTALHLRHAHQHASELNIDIARLRAILYHATCRKLVRQIGGADHGRRDATVVENRAASRDSNPDEAGAFLIYNNWLRCYFTSTWFLRCFRAVFNSQHVGAGRVREKSLVPKSFGIRRNRFDILPAGWWRSRDPRLVEKPIEDAPREGAMRAAALERQIACLDAR